ncbi:flagellar motor protein MotB [Halopseudomonas nanhaiensis]|uniref:flagellar motor protein MotB n=1 Tax=Halopseudomonas nanhaiensis TaxID=2830842 RepID=UPI001CBC7A0F|nr:flagellar motor protein MotB [Halopseudomonas nanhaiensis]UAW99122.1 flagellar motor protein MotB [Halopseudomonas nanhaiensis]
MDNSQPIIVKRISRKAAGHHGGSWKIAFADFAVAMMAFFLVMWLLSTATPEQLKMISGYFNDPIGFSEGGSPFAIDLGGTPTVSPQETLNDAEFDDTPLPLSPDTVEQLAEQAEQKQLDLLLQELQNRIDTEPVLQKFKDQILLEITADGLRIQIVDAENRPMFASGSPQLQPYFEEILLALSDTIAKVPKKISIGGHTDAQPFRGRAGYGNWELSAERANAARRTLLVAGYPEEQVARVVGYADSALFDRANPLNPVNRRIDIIVLNKRAEDQLLDAGGSAPADAPESAEESKTSVEPPLPSAEAEPAKSAGQEPGPADMPAAAPRSLNLFDDAGRLQELDQP